MPPPAAERGSAGGGLYADRLLDVAAAGCELPGVGGSFDGADAAVVEEAEVLKAREELGDLALVADTRFAGDEAVAGVGVLGDRHQDTHRPVSDPHLQAVQWVAGGHGGFCLDLWGRLV